MDITISKSPKDRPRVYHLAGELVTMLKNRQPELEISKEDILCVKIAGLCHDLGHGPFSHMFDGHFLPAVSKKMKHEELSVKMFDHLLKRNDLNSVLEDNGLFEDDRNFIKELIMGPNQQNTEEPPKEQKAEPPKEESAATSEKRQREYNERHHGKRKFLFEIVSNKRNGIDVDKWDYFARDCRMVGINSNFDHTRCMNYAKVLETEDGGFQICFRDKEVRNLYEMFHTRNILQRIACQHRVGNIIDAMITEALFLARDVRLISDKDGKEVTISETVNDMDAYQKLTDNIFQDILWSRNPSLEASRKILEKIQLRDLYKCVGQTLRPIKQKLGGKDIKDGFLEILGKMKTGLTKKDIVTYSVNMDYGMGDKNPIDNVRFYGKKDPTKPKPIAKNEVSFIIPDTFAEQLIEFYCKKTDEESIEQATAAFKEWNEKNSLTDDKKNLEQSGSMAGETTNQATDNKLYLDLGYD
ncbi:deoxynucleoside triphosphate triphosphohydrolase SAMHD1-like [Saccostrea cucullata]|uniref:deoxynucleoside triphosphate triphosphohydrolase SAMHD1-like n=1 Tax=Saccostrea cuccullata TaxID=36930 RepID=UPI002ED1E3CC